MRVRPLIEASSSQHSPDRRKLRFSIRFVLLALCGLGFVWSTGIGQSVKNWERFRYAQGIAGPDEMWLFLQVDRMIHLPGVLVSAPTRSSGHRQVVVIISADETVQRIALPAGNASALSFHPNLGHIFRHGDATYLFQGASRRASESLSVWVNDEFVPVPAAEGERLIRSNGLSGLYPGADALDALSVSAGWKPLLTEGTVGQWSAESKETLRSAEGNFTWRGRRYSWEAMASANLVEVSLRVDDPTGTRRISLLRYDPRRRTGRPPHRDRAESE